MVKELMDDFTKKIDEIEGLIEDELLTKTELRFIRSRTVKEHQRVAAIGAGMSEDELVLQSVDMMRKLLIREK